MATYKPKFEVHAPGLAKLLERRGKSFAVIELIQNAWDENTTSVEVSLTRAAGSLWELRVADDNPDGFADLSHAYTLFAESAKKADPTKRGRFNLGEKLVIAICKSVSIATTKGTVVFDDNGRRHLRSKTDAGTVFTGHLRMTAAEAEEVRERVLTLIPPHSISTTFNGVEIPKREPVATFTATLRTLMADLDGNLKPTTRKTDVSVYNPLPGEAASIYEMGLPVVETGDRFHVDVGQKVPVNMDRDNVPPGWLRDLRALVLNHTIDKMSDQDTTAAWVSNAIEDEAVSDTAVQGVVRGRFGEKAVRADPSDPESVKRAVSAGYTPIAGGAFSGAAWQQIKAKGDLQPTSAVTPGHFLETSPDGVPTTWLEPEKWTAGIANCATFASALAEKLLGVTIDVRFAVKTHGHNYAATWSKGHPSVLTINVQRLGYAWFDLGVSQAMISLLLHEFAHERVSDHMSDRFIDECTALGAKLCVLALSEPSFFEPFGVQVPALVMKQA